MDLAAGAVAGVGLGRLHLGDGIAVSAGRCTVDATFWADVVPLI
jgi:hypothetical protein